MLKRRPVGDDPPVRKTFDWSGTPGAGQKNNFPVLVFL
jgi:hypothetical protein